MDFWQWLQEIAAECGCTVKALIEGIGIENPMLVDQMRGTRKRRPKPLTGIGS
jgi:hypothetical protein